LSTESFRVTYIGISQSGTQYGVVSTMAHHEGYMDAHFHF